ncbi:hypothetical protein [Mycoplasma sp. E35C]|uniref:hypothetical protein n=1 Tax=Mycoplasma sp. E35C TaxID=2801918 RepID=UPI001CA42B92|nr:hypothetical protein [Mycoplasma sp. E35C]QZX49432.1 hypothetical protein JJE79_01650 [Mycoplasma sp. E35C]
MSSSEAIKAANHEFLKHRRSFIVHSVFLIFSYLISFVPLVYLGIILGHIFKPKSDPIVVENDQGGVSSFIFIYPMIFGGFISLIITSLLTIRRFSWFYKQVNRVPGFLLLMAIPLFIIGYIFIAISLKMIWSRIKSYYAKEPQRNTNNISKNDYELNTVISTSRTNRYFNPRLANTSIGFNKKNNQTQSVTSGFASAPEPSSAQQA